MPSFFFQPLLSENVPSSPGEAEPQRVEGREAGSVSPVSLKTLKHSHISLSNIST